MSESITNTLVWMKFPANVPVVVRIGLGEECKLMRGMKQMLVLWWLKN